MERIYFVVISYASLYNMYSTPISMTLRLYKLPSTYWSKVKSIKNPVKIKYTF